jgi:hypothetical protein
MGYACFPLFSNGATACWPDCNADSQCHEEERCKRGVADPEFGFCETYCDPAGLDPVATPCAAGSICVQVPGQSYGFCEELNGLCFNDAGCVGGQACEWLDNHALGRCVDGCEDDSDCAEGMECRKQAGGETCAEDRDCPSGVCQGGTCAASTVGVCRAPNGSCAAPEDADADGQPDQPSRGDAQCLTWQRCTSTDPNTVGSCVDR